MSRFHSLKVTDVIMETKDAVSIGFEVPANLHEDFKYKQGQYLTIKLNIEGEELRRSYSICSSPTEEGQLRVAVKKVTGGKVSTYINDNIKVGDVLEVMVPMGSFYTEMNANNTINYVLFAGGSGITPMISILKTALKEEPNSKVDLFYANNAEASIIFKDEIASLAQANKERLRVYLILNEAPDGQPNLLKGIMTKEKAQELIKTHVTISESNEYFVCGPGPMMENVSTALKSLNLNENKIHIEYFTSPVAEELDNTSTTVSAVNDSKHSATIVLDEETHQVELEENESILDAAIRIDIDPPYACQGGSCSTCKALLEDGEVKMDATFGLSPKEIKKKYILTCQSTPTTQHVTVNFDKA